MKLAILPILTLLLTVNSALAYECKLDVSNDSEVSVKVTIPPLLNRSYLEPGSSVSHSYSSGKVGWVEDYQVPISVLNGRHFLLQGLWFMGGAVIGQAFASPSFFRDTGTRSKNLSFKVKEQTVPLRINVSCK